MTKEIVVGRKTSVQPQPRVERQRRKTLIEKMVSIIIRDVKNFIFRKQIIIESEPEGWADYQRFCEMARGKR